MRKVFHVLGSKGEGRCDIRYDLKVANFGGENIEAPERYGEARIWLSSRGYHLPHWKLEEDLVSININSTESFNDQGFGMQPCENLFK